MLLLGTTISQKKAVQNHKKTIERGRKRKKK
jgi:hypothetical protein